MGTPFYAVQGAPAVEIVQELMPEEGVGPVREIGYQHLPLGAYDTREHPETEDEEFNHILHEFAASIAAFEEKDPTFNNAYGILTITQEQPSLKRITWEINWLSPEGQQDQFLRTFFLHENSLYWEQYGLKDFSFIRPPAEE
jgi:hypothetical protein